GTDEVDPEAAGRRDPHLNPNLRQEVAGVDSADRRQAEGRGGGRRHARQPLASDLQAADPGQRLPAGGSRPLESRRRGSSAGAARQQGGREAIDQALGGGRRRRGVAGEEEGRQTGCENAGVSVGGGLRRRHQELPVIDGKLLDHLLLQRVCWWPEAKMARTVSMVSASAAVLSPR